MLKMSERTIALTITSVRKRNDQRVDRLCHVEGLLKQNEEAVEAGSRDNFNYARLLSFLLLR